MYGSSFRRALPAPQHRYFLLQSPLIFSSFLRSISSKIGDEDTKKNRFTISYLVNSCGLSLESAKSASKYVQFETPEKPDSFSSLLKSRGFSQTQISRVVMHCPQLLLSKPENVVLPKLHFLRSRGLSDPEIAKHLSSCPYVLKRSLKNHIIPTYDYLKGLFQSDEKTIVAITRLNRFPFRNIEVAIVRNVDFLRDNGVPESNICKLLLNWPEAVAISLDRIKQVVEEARDQMAFDPSNYVFLQAFVVLAGMTRSTWESKVDVFKKWNLSEEQVLAGFRQFPRIMCTSEKKVTEIMELLVNEMGWEPSVIVKYPVLLGLSFEKRLLPRASVLRYLVSKGLMKKEHVRPSLFKYPEAEFLLRFVKRYQVPELLKLYGESLLCHDNQAISEGLPQKSKAKMVVMV